MLGKLFGLLKGTPAPEASSPGVEAQTGAAPATEEAPPPRTGLPFILVVDDDANIRDLLATYLEGKGHRVTTAADGWQAVIQSEGLNVVLLVSDIMMPGPQGTGVEALQQLRTSRVVRHDLPVIFMTAMTPADAKKMLPQDPRVRLIHKPVDFSALDALIAEFLPAR